MTFIWTTMRITHSTLLTLHRTTLRMTDRSSSLTRKLLVVTNHNCIFKRVMQYLLLLASSALELITACPFWIADMRTTVSARTLPLDSTPRGGRPILRLLVCVRLPHMSVSLGGLFGRTSLMTSLKNLTHPAISGASVWLPVQDSSRLTCLERDMTIADTLLQLTMPWVMLRMLLRRNLLWSQILRLCLRLPLPHLLQVIQLMISSPCQPLTLKRHLASEA
mmetsp:Transcript_15783/g.26384  ORF Transcript_15783/g.26384 Transcript_15783/m.26384 type:complete len:221 (-) Transcript_15783:408-1070(-)